MGQRRPWEIEYRVCCADTSIRWVSERGIGVFGDGSAVTYLDGIILDISERRKSEERLRFLGAISANVSDSIVATDTQFRINYINRKAELLYGYTLEELSGKTPDLLNADPMAAQMQKDLYDKIAGRYS